MQAIHGLGATKAGLAALPRAQAIALHAAAMVAASRQAHDAAIAVFLADFNRPAPSPRTVYFDGGRPLKDTMMPVSMAQRVSIDEAHCKAFRDGPLPYRAPVGLLPALPVSLPRPAPMPPVRASYQAAEAWLKAHPKVEADRAMDKPRRALNTRLARLQRGVRSDYATIAAAELERQSGAV